MYYETAIFKPVIVASWHIQHFNFYPCRHIIQKKNTGLFALKNFSLPGAKGVGGEQ